MFAAGDERNIMAGRGELSTKVSTDGSSAHHGDTHAPSFISLDSNLRAYSCQISLVARLVTVI
jgi:hypothetical protein